MNTNPPDPWLDQFRARIGDFASARPDEGLPISIKLRVDSGCFCRNCCPEAHRQIKEYLHAHPEVQRDGHIVEHESGPEILTYIQLGAGIAALSASIINLVVAIIKARTDGAEKGDRHGIPFKLIVRCFDNDRQYHEELIAEVPCHREIDPNRIAKQMLDHADRIRTHGKARRHARNTKKAEPGEL